MRWLFVIVGALLGVVIVLSLIRCAPLIEMIPLMLVLLMSAVPVALPVMFTVSMAVGSKELAKRGVLVTRLSATEDAATMDVLCVDKTGTITMNQLAVTGGDPAGRGNRGRRPVRRGACVAGRATRTRLTLRSSPQRDLTSSITSQRSRPSPSRRSMRKTSGRKPWLSRTDSGCAVMEGASAPGVRKASRSAVLVDSEWTSPQSDGPA